MKYKVKNQNTIKIIYLLKSLDIGGVERSTIRYANELIKRGYWIGFFAPPGIFSHANIIDNRIKLYHLNNNITTNILTLYKVFKLLREIVNRDNITIVHYQQRVFIPVII